jgi:capsid protein
MTPLRKDKRDMFAASEVTNLTQSWGTTPVPINEIIRRSLTALRARSREQIRNNDYAKKFIGMLKTNVVGPAGFNFNARSKDTNGSPDKMANTAIEKAFKKWSKRKNCDLVGRQSFVDMCRTMIATVAGDGETLHRIRIGRTFGKFGFQLEALEAYHLREYVGVDPLLGLNTYVSGKYRRVPAAEIIHCYLVDNPGQIRGFPWLSTPLSRLNMLGGFEEAALVNARAGAGKMGFYKNMNDLSEGHGEYDDAGELVDDSDPGSWHKLPPGVEIQEYDPTYPNNEFETFVKSSLRGIAAGLGVSYHTLANDLAGVNYSSGRLGMFDERDVWKMLQGWMSECFLEVVYERWLNRTTLTGLITTQGKPLRTDDESYEKYSEVEFSGRRWPGMDPAKESKANNEGHALKTKSRSQIIRDEGREPEDVWQEMADEEKVMESMGLDPSPIPPPAPGAPKQEEDEEDEDDE